MDEDSTLWSGWQKRDKVYTILVSKVIYKFFPTYDLPKSRSVKTIFWDSQPVVLGMSRENCSHAGLTTLKWFSNCGPREAAAASSENLLEIQVLRCHWSLTQRKFHVGLSECQHTLLASQAFSRARTTALWNESFWKSQKADFFWKDSIFSHLGLLILYFRNLYNFQHPQ